MAASALEIDRLTVRFDGRTVIDGFSLALAHGERAVITGDSGTGKSTVLRCILGFVSSFEGRILVAGERVGASSIWKLRLRMSYVTQEPQLGTERVKDVLERPFRYRANTGLRSNLSDIVGVSRFYRSVRDGEPLFLHHLAQGARLGEAVAPFLREASQAALAPTVASMATLGLVSLPGMMTGVILAGADPVTAIKYQIAIMIAIFSGTAITVPLVIWLTMKSSFNGYGVLDRGIFAQGH